MSEINNTQEETDKTRQTKALGPQYPVSPVNVEDFDVDKYMNTVFNQNLKRSFAKNILKYHEGINIECSIIDKFTIVELEYDNKHFYGLSVRNPNDTYNAKMGIARAIRRAFVELENSVRETLGIKRTKRYIDPAKNNLEGLVIVQMPSENELLGLSRQVMREFGLLG